VVPLKSDPRLQAAAQAHANDMATRGYFSHTSLDGRSPAQRVRAAGYPSSYIGENIAWGYRDWNAAITGWMNSAGHRANLLRREYQDIGLGLNDRRYVAVFGAQR
jgi:uncharacterized protein YkwD